MTPTQLWQRYLKTHPQAEDALVSSYYFGETKEEANAAVTRICLGEKTGCISFPQSFEVQGVPCPQRGDYAVITDFAGNGICVIQILWVEELTLPQAYPVYRRMDRVEESPQQWLAQKQAQQQQVCRELDLPWQEEMPVLLESFRVVFKVKRVKVKQG